MNISENLVLNDVCKIHFARENIVLVKTLNERFSLKGNGVTQLVKDILGCLNTPTKLEEIIGFLSNKYKIVSIKKMLDLFIDKKIIVNQIENENLKKIDFGTIRKLLPYTIDGKSFDEIVQDLSKLHIGIIGTNQLVESIYHELIKYELLTYFSVCCENDEIDLFSSKKLHLNVSNMLSDLSNVRNLINESDIVIAASDYYNHYFFSKIDDNCIEANKNWIRVVIDNNTVEIGPLFIPKQTLCYECLQNRSFNSMEEDEYAFDVLYKEKHSNFVSLSNLSLYYLNSLASSIISSELIKYCSNEKSILIGKTLIIDGINYKSQLNNIYIDYYCNKCGKGVDCF